jgi:hypothetical protein
VPVTRTAWLAAISAIAVISSNAAAQQIPIRTQLVIERRVTTMLHAIDALDWQSVAAAFSPGVRIDYTSLFGGTVEVLTRDSLVARWKRLLPGFDATQHLTGPVLVTRQQGRTASAETQVRGYHYIADAHGGPVWMVAGRYEFAMEEQDGEWRIAGIVLRVAYQEGNLDLPAFAMARTGRGEGRMR